MQAGTNTRCSNTFLHVCHALHWIWATVELGGNTSLQHLQANVVEKLPIYSQLLWLRKYGTLRP